MTKLNIGCGRVRYPGFVNIDREASVKPDIVADLRKRMPFEDSSVDEIWIIHTIEHIEKFFHAAMLLECHRMLKEDATLIIAYPEFLKCAENYEVNHEGRRDFWEATIYGRQTQPGDYHVALMNTPFFLDLLLVCGFRKSTAIPEPQHPYNTIVRTHKGVQPTTRQELYRKEIFENAT